MGSSSTAYFVRGSLDHEPSGCQNDNTPLSRGVSRFILVSHYWQVGQPGTQTGTYRCTQTLTVYGSIVQTCCGTIRHSVWHSIRQFTFGTHRV